MGRASRGDDHEVAGPVFAENQAGPFDEVEQCVEECARLEGAEMGSVDAGDPRKHGVDDVVLRIESQVGDEPLGGRARVIAEEAEDADPDDQRHGATEPASGCR